MKKFLALSPIVLLFALFLVFFLTGDISSPIPVIAVFMTVAVYSVAICGGTVHERVNIFSESAANRNIMYMIWIFVLAGAFGMTAKEIGAVDATVSATLSLVPVRFLPAGMFIAACFISMAIGTSVGTIVVLCPIASGLAEQFASPVGWFVAIVVGGAFFGDNLSFISDTTIAATQTQGCSMRDKFRSNFLLVLPAAVISIIIYLFSSELAGAAVEIHEFQWFKIIPYLFVMILMFMGMNVLTILALAIFITGSMGLAAGDFDLTGLCGAATQGVSSMSELIVVTMLAGGILGVVKHMKGLEYAMEAIGRNVHSTMHAEFAIAEMTALADLCTANNTIAILTVGDMTREIAEKYSISPKRAASIMDTVSCFVQGVIPYGAQLLMASALAGISASEVIPNLYYPMLTGVMVILSILINHGKKSR